MKRAAKKAINPLLEAVQFVSHAQQAKGDDMATHCMVRYGMIVANNRTLAAGTPIIESDLHCCPQTDLLRSALERCGSEHSITQADGSLFLRSGDFSAYVPVIDGSTLAVAVPDAPIAACGDRFRDSLGVTASLVKDNAPTLLQSSIQLLNGSTISTNGAVILQHWHGFNMPDGLVIPACFAKALCKIKKTIAAWGYSRESFTIHFEDHSWIMTQRYRDAVPIIENKLTDNMIPFELPVGIFGQVEQVARFSEDGRVYVYEDAIRSHHPEKVSVGAYQSRPMPELRQGVSYSIAAMDAIAKHATHFDDRASERATMFYGKDLRGAIARDEIRFNPNIQPCTICGHPSAIDCECIPF